jgi:hypothetical protein
MSKIYLISGDYRGIGKRLIGKPLNRLQTTEMMLVRVLGMSRRKVLIAFQSRRTKANRAEV